jgi:hypothetical protein
MVKILLRSVIYTPFRLTQLTNRMENSPSSGGNRFSASQEILHI